MFRIAILVVVCVFAASCSSTSTSLLVPVKVYEQSNTNNTDWPVIWAENASKRSSVITKINGESFGSRPRAIIIPPGNYNISVYSVTHVDLPTIQSTPYVEFDIDVVLEAGHNYVIRYKALIGGRYALPYLEDMGEGKSCKYVTGRYSFYLDCRSAAP